MSDAEPRPEGEQGPSLQDLFPDLRPIGGAPTLFLINGCGLTLYGDRDRDGPTRTYVKTPRAEISLLLYPADPAVVLRSALRRAAEGDAAAARETLAAGERRGVPLPYAP